METARIFTAPDAASGAAIAVHGETLELDVGSDALPRTLRIAPLDGHTASDDAGFALVWRQSDLRYGVPRLAADQREQWTPQQLGLDRLNGYSVKKGCYPGQEIVARTHFLGKAKRSLALLECISFANAGDSVQHVDSNIGTVACVAGPLALAVLPLELPEGPLQVNGEVAIIQPLLEGLAR